MAGGVKPESYLSTGRCGHCSAGAGNHLPWCRLRGGSGRLVAPERRTYWMTTVEAQDKLGVDMAEINRLIKRGVLAAIKVGTRRMVKTDSVKQYYFRRTRAHSM